MKKEMLEYLEGYWTNGRDHEILVQFIDDFFSQYQPERLSEKIYYRNEDGTYPPLESMIECDSLNSTNKERSRE